MIVTRRAFLAGLGAAGAGLALGLGPASAAAAGPAVLAPNPFVQIGTDGVVTIVCHRSEMGQGIRSSLPVLIAEELGADPATVRVVQADGDDKYGDQNTDGSSSIRDAYEDLRKLGATARFMLIAAAAKKWRVPAKKLRTENGFVVGGGKRAGFGALVEAAAKLPVPKDAPLRPDAELTRVGTALPLVDGPDYVTGKAIFGADVRLPGMLTAVIARPYAPGDKVARLDDAAARKVPGVRKIVQIPAPTLPPLFQALGGVAVLADHTWAALRGRAALEIEWEKGAHGDYDSEVYGHDLFAAVSAAGQVVREVGDAEAALGSAKQVVEALYHNPHLVHQPMEPPAAVARVDGDRCEVWAPTQSPQTARDEVAGALGIPPANVTMHVTLLGGGFGRKSKPDFIVEAARLSKEAGVPVRVQWTREDEIRHAYYHTTCTQALAAGLDAEGNVVAWRHRVAFPTISSTFAPDQVRPGPGELQQGILDLPLAIPNVRVEVGEARAKQRIGWYRSVSNINHAFAVQSFIAELAEATKRDPKEMLLAVLGPERELTAAEAGLEGMKAIPNYGAPPDKHPIDVGRLRRVIERVTASAKWDEARTAGRAVGLAAHRSFLSYVAVVAAVEKGPRGPVVDEVWITADVGKVINADRVRAQLEGAVVFGMTIALHGRITARDGAIEQTNFRDAPIVRINEVPRKVHVDVVDSDRPPGGVGEPGVPPVVPAIVNAIAVLTGERTRSLPVFPAKVRR